LRGGRRREREGVYNQTVRPGKAAGVPDEKRGLQDYGLLTIDTEG